MNGAQNFNRMQQQNINQSNAAMWLHVKGILVLAHTQTLCISI